MKFRHALILLTLVFGAKGIFAQRAEPYAINFEPVFGSAQLQLENSFYKIGKSDSARIDVLKFYISGIELLQNGKVVWKEANSFHLVDAADIKTERLLLHLPTGIVFNSIKLNIGIDSLTNVSGAIGGDLDPTKGMYWTWQNGYINFKVEGVSNVCPTRKNQFQFHIGGYLSPNATLQTVVLKAGQKATTVYVDLAKLLAGINMPRQNQIMTPGAAALAISAIVASVFSTKAP